MGTKETGVHPILGKNLKKYLDSEEEKIQKIWKILTYTWELWLETQNNTQSLEIYSDKLFFFPSFS